MDTWDNLDEINTDELDINIDDIPEDDDDFEGEDFENDTPEEDDDGEDGGRDIPVYLFVGFLESGKTRFIQETMEDPRFDSGDKTLLLLCEEGIEEYIPEKFAFEGVTIRSLEDKSELNAENLSRLCEECGARRVIMEYNGMWFDKELLENFPDNWLIYQTICTVDGTTFRSYYKNMRELLLDKFSVSELVVVNRAEAVTSQEDQEFIHKCVRQATRRADIAYEFKDGSVSYDELPDELPYDINADIIDIGDNDYGVWYMDICEEAEKYDGKTIRYKAQVCQSKRVADNEFVPGRFVMTCCSNDIQFIGFPCRWPEAKQLKVRSWIQVTASIKIQPHPLYGDICPVLTASVIEPAEAPEQDVATFF